MNIWAIKEPEVRCDEHSQRDYLEFQTHIFSFLKVFGCWLSPAISNYRKHLSMNSNSVGVNS